MTGWNSAAFSVSPLKPSDETLDIRQLENGLERPGARSPATTAPLASLAGIDALVGVLRRGILGTISAVPETEITWQYQGGAWLPFLDTYRTMCLAPTSYFRRILEEAGLTLAAAQT